MALAHSFRKDLNPIYKTTSNVWWAGFQKIAKKVKLHLGFDLNHGVPRKLFLTEGNGAERPFVSRIIDPGQTGVLDRGYQAHRLFDHWQQDGCHFVCRIKEDTHIEIIEEFPVHEKSHVFFDAMVLLGTPNVNQTKNLFTFLVIPLRANPTG